MIAYFSTSGEQQFFVIHNIGKEELELVLPEGFDQVIFSLGKAEINS